MPSATCICLSACNIISYITNTNKNDVCLQELQNEIATTML